MVQKKEEAIERAELFLTILSTIVEKIYGDNGKKVLEFMLQNNNLIIEETAGKDLDIKSNEIRRILQKLSEEAVVVPVKVREQDKTLHGWTLNKNALEGFVLNRLKKAKEKLALRARGLSESTYFVCPSCNRRYSYEEAFANDFRCPNDNSLLQELDVSSEIEVLSEYIGVLDRVIKALASGGS